MFPNASFTEVCKNNFIRGQLCMLLKIVFITIILPFILSLIFYIKFKRFLWLVPILAFVIGFVNILYSIVTCLPNESFINKLFFYFRNDSIMELSVIYLPIFVFSSVFTLLFYVFPKLFKYKK